MSMTTRRRPALAAPAQQNSRARTGAWALTFAGIAVGGALLRLFALGDAPFAPQEAAAAWPALRTALAQPVEGMAQPTSALLHNLLLVLFWLVQSGGEVLARLPVALLGAAVPALAWFWQARLGRSGALLLALLLAIDPWLVTFSRLGTSTGLTVALALAAMTAIEVSGRRPWKAANDVAANDVAAISAGLLLISGPQAWSWLVPAATAALLIGPPLATWRTPRTALAAGAAALVGATALLAHPAGLRALAVSLGEWGAQALPGPYPLWFPWLRLPVDNPLLLFLGVSGAAIVLRRALQNRAPAAVGTRTDGQESPATCAAPPQQLFYRFLLLWTLWATLILLAPGRLPDALPLLGVALAFCAATAWGSLATRAAAEVSDRREFALVAAVLAAVLFALLFLVVSIVATPKWDSAMAIAAGALLLLTLLLVAGYAWYVNPHSGLLVGLAVLSLFLLGATTTSLTALAFRHDARHPDGFFFTVALPEADNLTTDLGRLSSSRTGNPTEHPLWVSSGPTLAPDAQTGWLVRPMRNVTWAAAPPAPLSATLFSQPGQALPRQPFVITPPLESELALSGAAWNAGYLGADFPLRSSWLPNALPRAQGETAQERWESGFRPRLRWLIYREATPAVAESVLLWAPAE